MSISVYFGVPDFSEEIFYPNAHFVVRKMGCQSFVTKSYNLFEYFVHSEANKHLALQDFGVLGPRLQRLPWGRREGEFYQTYHFFYLPITQKLKKSPKVFPLDLFHLVKNCISPFPYINK